MPKKFLIHIDFAGPAPPRPVVQLSVNFWYLGLLVLGANLVLGSMLVGNHWSKVTPKLENSLLIFFRVAITPQPFGFLIFQWIYQELSIWAALGHLDYVG